MALTPRQRGRLLERIASILHEEVSTEGFSDLVDGQGMDDDAATAFVRAERDRYLYRAARLLGGEASTQNGSLPATPRRKRR